MLTFGLFKCAINKFIHWKKNNNEINIWNKHIKLFFYTNDDDLTESLVNQSIPVHNIHAAMLLLKLLTSLPFHVGILHTTLMIELL